MPMSAAMCGTPDFDRRYFYLNGLRQGICYPCPPQRNSAAEERAWKEFEKFLKTRDPAAIFCMQKVAGYLNNVLEDVYVESLMCQEFREAFARQSRVRCCCHQGYPLCTGAGAGGQQPEPDAGSDFSICKSWGDRGRVPVFQSASDVLKAM